jgi:hypothetical protein
LSAILEHEKRVNGRPICFETSDLFTGLERGAKEEEQAWPATVTFISRLYEVAQNAHDLETWLILAESTLSCQRIDSFMGLDETDVSFTSGQKRVKLEFRHLKGEKKNKTHTVEFERLTQGVVKVNNTKYGKRNLCPVELMSTIVELKRDSGRDTLFSMKYATYLRSLSKLCDAAGIANHCEGRRRALYTAHSSRVGGVCMLLRAGLSENVVSNICNWDSDIIKRYSKRLALEPSFVEPYKFYNPISLSHLYNSVAVADDDDRK